MRQAALQMPAGSCAVWYAPPDHLALLDVEQDPGQARLLQVRKYPGYAEAHAALAAVEWGTGEQAKAEEQLEAATTIESGWGRMNFVKDFTRWPPRCAAGRCVGLQGSKAVAEVRRLCAGCMRPWRTCCPSLCPAL